MSSVGYERMRMESGLDILDISALTTFSVGQITAHALKRSPTLLLEVLRCRQWSYLNYVPNMIGQSTVLDDAARCLSARVKQCLQRPYSQPTKDILAYYVKAVKSLQLALDDVQHCLEPEVLCATQLLGVYEVCRCL